MDRALKHLKFLFVVWAIFAQLAIAHAINVVPVMLWCGDSSSSLINPLQKTSRPEFEGILAEQLGKSQPPMIVFVKDNFCVEDVKYHKQSLQQLNNAGSLTYLTSVESALSVFENLSPYNITVEDDLESITEGQLALIQINDLNAVPDIYNMVRESTPNLIVALTGKSCGYATLERVKRVSGSVNNTKHLIINQTEILFYADKNPLIKFNKEDYIQLENLISNFTQKDNEHYYLKMNFGGIPNGPIKIELTAQFNITKGYFRFLGFQYQANGKPEIKYLKSKSDIYFPFNFSYHCFKESIFSYKNKESKEEISLKILNLQVQMDATKFSDSYDCVGFMSIPIWTGIFVTAILAIIMIWGLTMIIDIRTMDRFDDPKGKTITISAQE